MTVYSTISIDMETKKRAAKKAKGNRMTISVITRILLNDYADGKIRIGAQMLVTPNGFTPEFEDEILAAEEEDSSPAFTRAKAAISFLHKKSKKVA